MLRRPQYHIPLSIPISYHLSYLPIHLHHLYGRQHNHALSGYESNRCGEFLSMFFTFAHSIALIAYHCCIHVVFLALTSILSPPIENEAQLVPRRSPLDLSEITNAATATSWLPLGSPIYTWKSILIQVTSGRNWSRWSSLLPLNKRFSIANVASKPIIWSADASNCCQSWQMCFCPRSACLGTNDGFNENDQD